MDTRKTEVPIILVSAYAQFVINKKIINPTGFQNLAELLKLHTFDLIEKLRYAKKY